MIRIGNYDEYIADNKKHRFLHNPFPYNRMPENLL